MHVGVMKPGQNVIKQRSRGRGNNGGGKRMPPRNQTYDSNGPDVRIRGNAHQVLEKYLAMARDASAQGDRISAENYYQHAEHYFRLINHQAQASGHPQSSHIPCPADDHAVLSGDYRDEENESNASDDDIEETGSDENNDEEEQQPEVVNA